MSIKTRNGYEEIDKLVEKTMNGKPEIFPYTVRELAAMYGIGTGSVYAHLNANPNLYRKGKRWVYRSKKSHE